MTSSKTINWYPWLNAPYRQLLAPYQQKRGHHALLIQALSGMGAEALVYALSRWLLCAHPQGDKSCATCHSCNLMISGNHPDWHLLTLEKGKNSLGVEQVRQLIEKLYNFSQQGGAKVIWLAAAELLTEAAANALLKTLEEPPPHTYFLISCRESSRLLATLRSRCFYWQLLPPEASMSAHWLSRQLAAGSLAIQTALRLNQGAPLAALALLQPERWQQRKHFCQQLSVALQHNDLLGLLPQLNHHDVADRLHWLTSLMLDAIKYQQGAAHYIINLDQQPLIDLLANWRNNQALQQDLQHWLLCRHRLRNVVGVNAELVLTDQLLQWENSR